MSVLSRFDNIPIVRRARAAYAAFVGTNQAQESPVGVRPALPPGRYREEPGIVGTTELELYNFKSRREYQQPQEEFQKAIRADAAMILNPQLKTAIKNYCYGAAGTFRGIKVVSAPNKQTIEDLFKRFSQRCKLKKYLAEIVRRTALYGNGYLQHDIGRVSNSQAQIERLIWMPVYSMVRMSNEIDEFENVDHAYEQQEPSLRSFGTRAIVKRKDGLPAVFPEWAINHLRLFSLQGEPYGHSLIESVLYTGAVDRLYEMMLSLYWNRKYSSSIDVHSIPGPENTPPTKGQIDDYIDRTSKTRRMEQGKAPVRDLYNPGGSITRLESDPNSDAIADIELTSEHMLSETGQSPQMISADRQANVGVLVEKFRQLYGLEEQFILHFCEGFKESFNFDLALHGIDPGQIEYEFQFGQQWLIQDLISINAQARADLKENQITEASRLNIAGQLYRFDPIAEAEALQKKREETAKQVQSQPVKQADPAENPDPNDLNSETSDRTKPTIDSDFTN